MNPIRSVNNARRRAQRPFNKLLKDWHKLVARKASDWSDGAVSVEYNPLKHQYTVTASHPKDNPDEYETGHSAGKLASMLGFIPIMLIFIGFEAVTTVLSALGEYWIAPILVVALSVAVALAILAGLEQLLTISVAYQVTTERRGGNG